MRASCQLKVSASPSPLLALLRYQEFPHELVLQSRHPVLDAGELPLFHDGPQLLAGLGLPRLSSYCSLTTV